MNFKHLIIQWTSFGDWRSVARCGHALNKMTCESEKKTIMKTVSPTYYFYHKYMQQLRWRHDAPMFTLLHKIRVLIFIYLYIDIRPLALHNIIIIIIIMRAIANHNHRHCCCEYKRWKMKSNFEDDKKRRIEQKLKLPMVGHCEQNSIEAYHVIYIYIYTNTITIIDNMHSGDWVPQRADFLQ